MNPIGAAAEFAILRLHEQEFEIIRGSQILENPRLAHRFFPEDVPLLPTQPIPYEGLSAESQPFQEAFCDLMHIQKLRFH